ncbi:MAG: BlaI/MecI/CopY family transcriptional regulator [Clostridiales bacterium]|nr:BlaI/MecI/CopY family transcriptional regulator [Clostridiales bacterium]
MDDLLLCESEYRLMEVIWKYAPVESGKLVGICERELNWKKSTMYTILRKLISKGMIRNDDSVVSVLIPKDRVQRFESKRVVKRSFGGSLPSFITAFLGDRTLSEEEADELVELIDRFREEN